MTLGWSIWIHMAAMPGSHQVLGETFEGEQVEKLLEEADLLKDLRESSRTQGVWLVFFAFH